MPRYFFEASYEGTDFLGWQKQTQEPTIQGSIEKEIGKLCSLKTIPITGCGRTDTGVHAKTYFFHADFEMEIDTTHFIFKLNLMLPKSISIQNIFKVEEDMHARFSAKLRTYRYFIHQEKDPFKTTSSWWITQNLDVDKMRKAAKLLKGTLDFEAFSKKHTDVNNHICSVKEALLFENKNELVFEISANRFLRNMVRAIVGTLIEIGTNKMSIDEFQRVIDSKSRQQAGASAPSTGLFLWDISYPELDA